MKKRIENLIAGIELRENSIKAVAVESDAKPRLEELEWIAEYLRDILEND